MGILHRVDYPKELEFEIRKHGGIYLAGAENVRFKRDSYGLFLADLYLKRVIESKPKKFHHPRIKKPYSTKPKYETSTEFFFQRITVPCLSFVEFSETLNDRLLCSDHKSYMEHEDINAFFGGIYSFYASISDDIRFRSSKHRE